MIRHNSQDINDESICFEGAYNVDNSETKSNVKSNDKHHAKRNNGHIPLSALDAHNLYHDVSSYFSSYGFFFKSDAISFMNDVLREQ